MGPGLVFRSLALKKSVICVCVVKPTKNLRGRFQGFQVCPLLGGRGKGGRSLRHRELT